MRQDRTVALRRTTYQSETYSLGTIRLYREDLHAIAKAAAELGPLRIETNGFVGDDPADFAALPAELTELRITAERANSGTEVAILFSRRNARIIVTESDTLASGIRVRIQEICRARLRPLRRRPFIAPMRGFEFTPSADRSITAIPVLLGFMIGVSSAALGSAALLRPFLEAQTMEAGTAWTIAVTTVLSLGGVIAFALFRLTKGAILINASAGDRPTFLQHKRRSVDLPRLFRGRRRTGLLHQPDLVSRPAPVRRALASAPSGNTDAIQYPRQVPDACPANDILAHNPLSQTLTA
ncbi:hypothetical protein ACFQ08_00115 [Streptosporangium algeriense]|uniref:Uncharacterized protein n=1 Tax=Streptosporangium algeriense TaxID=1682748 RepID=A0ABW3DGI3_9ACTN